MKILFTIFFIIFVTLQFAFAKPKPQDTTGELIWLKLADQDLGMISPMLNAIYTPDYKSILVSSSDKFLELNAQTGAIKREIQGIRGAYKFSDDGQYVYTYDFKKVNYLTGEVMGQFTLPLGTPTYFDLNEKAGLLILCYYNNGGIGQYPLNWKKGLWIYNLNTFKFIDTIGLYASYYDYVQIPDNGKYFITSSSYKIDPKTDTVDHWDITYWDTQTLDTVNSKYPEYDGNYKYSPDGRFIGIAGFPFIWVLDAQTFKEIYKWDPNKGLCPSNAIDFTTDSKYMITDGFYCDETQKISIWDLKTGSLAYKYSTITGTPILFVSKQNNNILAVSPGETGSSAGGLGLYRWPQSLSVIEKQDEPESIYPNPTTEEFTLINANFKTGQLNIILNDINGIKLQTLYDGFYKQEELKFNVSSLPDGIYLLTAIQDKINKTYKIIKEK